MRESSPEERAFDNAEYLEVPTLDLHGAFQDEAWLETERFLKEQTALGSEAVKIIHGIGKQVLKGMLMQKLKKHPSVKVFRPSERSGQMDAVLLVLLHRIPRKNLHK